MQKFLGILIKKQIDSPKLTGISSIVSAMTLWLLIGNNVFALPSDVNQPVTLTADSASFNEKKGMTEYKGNVEISQGSLKINAENLQINLTKKGGIKSAIARGTPAKMQQQVSAKKGIAKGQANKISYNASTGIIELIGNASLVQNGTSISGNQIRYSLKLGDFEAKRNKKQRVKLVIPANQNINLQSVRPQ